MARKKRPAKQAARRRQPVLGHLSPDWYWEQDDAYRFTRVDLREGVGKAERQLAATLIGKPRWDTGIQIEGGWDAHRRALDAREAFRDVLMWRDLDDGSRRWISTSGEPVFDARRRFKGYRGVGRDITEQKRTEARLRDRSSSESTRTRSRGRRSGLRSRCWPATAWTSWSMAGTATPQRRSCRTRCSDTTAAGSTAWPMGSSLRRPTTRRSTVASSMTRRTVGLPTRPLPGGSRIRRTRFLLTGCTV